MIPPGYTEIVSWSTYASEGAGQMLGLKVFDDNLPSNQYAVIRHDGLRTLTPETVNTFAVEIPVAGGDVIGLNTGNASLALPNGCVFSAPASDTYAFSVNAALNDGEGGTYAPEKLGRVNVSALVEAPPALTFVSPDRGPASGGTPVVIAGHDLTAAKSVTFGGAPAASFSVNSDNALTAVSPPSSASTVDVTVTTAAGTTAKSAADHFTFEPLPPGMSNQGPPAPSCVVPKLRRLGLAAVRRRLTAAHCHLGRITGPRGRRARVKGQSVKPGTVLPSGARVGVRLGVP